MTANPEYWQKYSHGDADEQRFARKYSFSDRSRYYWPVPEMQVALAQLIDHLETDPVPLSLLSQFMPEQYLQVRQGLLENQPRPLILSKINAVLDDYVNACG